MSPDELRKHWRSEPFIPFRLHVNDGRSFVVPRRDIMLVCNATTVVGVLKDGNEIPEFAALIWNQHITAVEPLAEPDTPVIVSEPPKK